MEQEEQKQEPSVDPKDQTIEELKAKLASLESEQKKIIDKRDSEKAKAREEAEKAGQYETAINLLKEELNGFKTKYNEAEIEDLRKTKQEYVSLVEQQKQSILSKFPTDKQETFKEYTLKQLLDIAQMIDMDVSTIPTVESKRKTGTGTATSKNWEDMTVAEQNAIYAENPELGKKMLRDSINRKK